MADDIASLGIKVDTDGVSRGVKALDVLADQGPKVEKALQGVETASTKTGKSLATLGQGNADAGLSKVAKTAKDASDGIGKLADTTIKTAASVRQVDKASLEAAKSIAGVGTAVKQLTASNESVAASIRGLTSAESAYTAKLQEEAAQLRAAVAERDKYVAQAQGMLSASKDIAAAIGGQVTSLRQVQTASAQTSESMLALARTGISAFLGGALVQGAKNAAAAIYEASAAGERLRTTLNYATGGKSAQEIEYIRQVTNRLGLEFQSTAVAYGKFQAASRGTSIEGAKARDVFESIAKASAVMGLTTEESSGALLALQQMLSKGTVQAEELRGQLGERLPVAFRVSAKAMGVTTAELGKMLEQGQIIADDFLPKFARALNEELGNAAEGAAERLDAAVNQLSSSWDRLKQRIGDAGVSKAVQTEIKAITNDITVFGETMDKIGNAGGGFLAQITGASAAEAGRGFFAILNGGANLLNGTINTLTGNFAGFLKLRTDMAMLPDFLKTDAQQAAALAQNLAQAEKQFAAMKAQAADYSENIYFRSEMFQLGEYIKKLKEAQAEQLRLKQGNTDNQSGDEIRAARSAEEARRLDAVRSAMQKVQQGLSDVKDSFYKNLNALYAGYQSGLITLADYQKQVAKLINDEGGGKERAAALKASTKELTDQKKLVAELNGMTEDFAEDWDKLSKAFKAGALNLDQLERSQAKLLEKQPAIKAAREAEIAIAKAQYAQELQTAEEVAAAYVAESKAREQGRLAVYAYGKAIDEQNDITALELSLVGKTQRARDIALAQYRIELDLKKQIEAIDKNIGFDEAQRIEERAKAREAAARAMAGAETRVYVDEWKRTSDEIERSLTDALMRGFESGKGFGKNLVDTLKNMFGTLVLRPIVQAAVQPFSASITGSVNGMLGSSSPPVGGLGNLGSIFGLQGLGGSFGSAFSGGTILGSDAIGAGWTALMNGSGTVAGNLGQMLGGVNGSLSGLGGLGGTLGYATALYSLSQGKYGSAAGTAIGTAFGGPIGAAIGSVIGSAIDKAFSGGAGTPHRGSIVTGTSSGVTTGGYDPNNILGHYEASTDAALKTLTASALQVLNSTASAFGSTAKYAAEAYFTADGRDASFAGLKLMNNGAVVGTTGYTDGKNAYSSNADEAFKSYTADAAKAVRDALESIGLPSWAKQTLDALGDAPSFDQLNQAVSQITATRDALKSLGAALPQIASLSDDAVASLLKAAGGIDSLASSANSYYENFYSQAEKTAASSKQLSDALAQLGITMPATREAYRALVEAQDLNTESGRAAYAQLLKLSPAFAALVPAVEDLAQAGNDAADSAAQAAAKMAEAGKQVLADLASQQGDLQVQLLRAQGEVTAAAALERQQALAKLTEGLSASDAAAATAAYDLNAALKAQIDATNAATAAAQQAAQAEAQRQQAVASERYNLEGQLLQLQGNTAALRERELAALDPTNRAILEQIYALQDQQAAEQAAAQAAAEAAQAAEQLRSAWQSVTDSIFNEVQRIRGLIGGNSAQSLAGTQAQFYITTTQARAGDQEAARMLPGLSQTLLQLAEANAVSLLDLQRIRAQIAASLEQTGIVLSNRYGLTLPTFDVGTNYVPQTMAAIVHEGEAIVPRAYNPAAGGGASSGEVVVSVLRELLDAVKAGDLSTVKLQTEANRMLKKWDSDGIPEQRATA